MTVNLSALAGAGQQFFDNNGNLLSGGKLWSYQAGTTTPQATYTTVAGNVAHTNPIVLDAAGRVATGEIWLSAGSNYKFVLMTSANVTLATWDNITGVNGTGIATNASNVAYDPPFTGALTENYTVEDKLAQTVSVKDFGAVGDGVANDTAAIQAALDAIPPYGFVDLSGLSYAVSGVVVLTNNVTVRNGRLVALSTASGAVIKAAPGTSGVQFENLRIYINKAIIAAGDCAGIFFDQCSNGKAINCHVDGSKNNNYVPQLYACIYGYLASKIDVLSCTVINADKEGIMFRDCDDIYIYDCEGRNSGFSNIGTSGGNRAIINGCRAFDSGATNITMNSQDSIVSNCLASGNALNNGILIGHVSPVNQNANNCLVSNNRVLNSAEYGVSVVYGTNVVIEGNTITNTTKSGIYVIPKPTTNGGTTISNNTVDGCAEGIYSYGSAENQTVITGNTVRAATAPAVLIASNGQVNISNNIFRNVSSGVLALGHVTGTTLTGAGITNLSISNNIFQGVTFGAITVRHLLQASFIGNIFETINASGTAGADLFTLENSNGGTASNMPTSVVFQSNTTKATNAASKLLDVQANIKDATITRFNFQNNDLQDFSPSNIFTGTGWGTTATYSAVGNQVGTDARAPQFTIASGSTTTVINNSNLLGRDVGPVLVANDAVFNTLNVRITNYAFGSITLTHTAPGGNVTASLTMA